MGSAPISTAQLLPSLTAVVLLEAVIGMAGGGAHLPRLWTIALARVAQASAVLALAGTLGGGMGSLGLERKTLLPGLKKGLFWSAGFAVAAGGLFLCLAVAGRHPLMLIRSPLPAEPTGQALYFAVGGIVAPIAEEIVFRGLLFGYLRRWGVAAALLISTALFAAIHLGPGIPVTQIVGGAVFAIAYHTGGSLVVPVVIHMLGNLAIFTLSLPVFH